MCSFISSFIDIYSAPSSRLCVRAGLWHASAAFEGRSALVSIIVLPLSSFEIDSKSTSLNPHEKMSNLSNTNQWKLTNTVHHREHIKLRQQTYWLLLLFQWKRSVGGQEEHCPSTTSRRRTSRGTWETSAMVIIIYIMGTACPLPKNQKKICD